QAFRREAEGALAGVLCGMEACGAFNQALMELGALVCVPNGDPHCAECPLADLCAAHAAGRETEFPVKAKAKARRIEQKTVLVIRDGERFALTKRPAKGLLAGMYEFPCAAGRLGEEEALKQAEALGFTPLRIRPLPEAKHIFSHVEWHMTGWVIRVAASGTLPDDGVFLVTREETERDFPVPAAYAAYLRELQVKVGPGEG
ncbi:MAG: NUDIX domain-containing protein, partial [Lachnospiraceae bacterium]|nr:NUDIX domain-containing protein [Lachnospiraceae bacterium]